MMTSGVERVNGHGIPQAAVGVNPGRMGLMTASAVYGTHTLVMRMLVQYGKDPQEWATFMHPILIRWGQLVRSEQVMVAGH
jgi:hypothetical protein